MAAAANQTSSNSTSQPLPIVIAGGGCVGLLLALLLAQSSISNPIIILEPEKPDINATRAMAHQPPTYPIFARAGLMSELSRIGSFANGICFRTSVANGSKLIAGKKFDVAKGEKGQLLLPQGKFQELLLKKLEELEPKKVELRTGLKVTGFTEQVAQCYVKVHCQDREGINSSIEAEYLVGADGAKSTVRKCMGVQFKGETLDAQLIATNIKYDFHAYGFYDANFIIDPDNYGLIGRIDNEGLWKVSFGVSRSTSEEEMNEIVEKQLMKMLPGRNGERKNFEVKQVAPYKAQQRYAETFWRGRVGLCGDAAHLTNPYAGLGLASGIADAAALADVLIRILASQASDSSKLLSSWSEERLQKFLSVIDKPSQAAFKRVRSKVETEEDIESLLSRDPLLSGLKKGMPVVPPSIETKVEDLGGW